MDYLIESLKKHKLKVTEDRREVLKALHNTRKPLSISDIYEQAKAHHQSLNITTVYRITEALVNIGLIQRLNFGDNQFVYELSNDSNHHHHLVCTSCGKVIDLENYVQESFIEKAAKEFDFEMKSHNIELFGVCGSCRS